MAKSSSSTVCKPKLESYTEFEYQLKLLDLIAMYFKGSHQTMDSLNRGKITDVFIFAILMDLTEDFSIIKTKSFILV